MESAVNERDDLVITLKDRDVKDDNDNIEDVYVQRYLGTLELS
jgi:hypothetical protein